MIAKFKKIREGALLPYKAHEHDAGYDVTCLVDTVITPGGRVLIQTGLSLELPEGYECQVRSRSGLALNKGIMVLNSPGTIDCNYRGEIGVILYNSSRDKVTIQAGTRVAQLVFNKLPNIEIVEVMETTVTDRGEGGFGSSGLVESMNKTLLDVSKSAFTNIQVYPESQDKQPILLLEKQLTLWLEIFSLDMQDLMDKSNSNISVIDLTCQISQKLQKYLDKYNKIIKEVDNEQ